MFLNLPVCLTICLNWLCFTSNLIVQNTITGPKAFIDAVLRCDAGATTSSKMSFKDMSRSQAGSFKGILCPIMNGSSRMRAQFSCAFPPIFFLEEKVEGNG